MGALSGADTSSVIAVSQNPLGLGVVSRSPKNWRNYRGFIAKSKLLLLVGGQINMQRSCILSFSVNVFITEPAFNNRGGVTWMVVV